MNKLPISVCIIAKNEENHIEECLKRIASYGFEIIVVDTGSNDRTIEIANQYADQTLSYTWQNNFSDARNYAIAHATNAWILVLDCDEYIEEIDCRQLQELTQKHIHHVGMMPFINKSLQETSENHRIDKVPRFFNRKYFHYEYSIHEQVTPIDRKQDEEVILETYTLPMLVTHVGYNLSKEDMLKKQERNLSILQNAIGKEGNDAYLYFQIGQSQMILNHIDQGIQAYEQCLTLQPNCEIEYVQIAVCSCTKAFLMTKQYEKGLAHIRAYEGKINTPDFLDLAGRVYSFNQMPAKALQVWLQLIHMPNRERIGEEEIYGVYVGIIKLFQMLGSKNWANQFRQELDEYASAHGKQISF